MFRKYIIYKTMEGWGGGGGSLRLTVRRRREISFENDKWFLRGDFATIICTAMLEDIDHKS